MVSPLIDCDSLFEMVSNLFQCSVLVHVLVREVPDVFIHDRGHAYKTDSLPQVALIVKVAFAPNFYEKVLSILELVVCFRQLFMPDLFSSFRSLLK